MTYLESLLNVEIKYENWKGKEYLPYYISANYEILKAFLKDVETIFLFPYGELGSTRMLKNHINKIQEIKNLPVVLCLSELSFRKRQQLINADIPFVVEDKQIYIPFIGVILKERYLVRKQSLKIFSPSTQLLLLYFIYQKTTEIPVKEIAKALSLSNMAISKAQRQLEQTGFFQLEDRERRRKVLVPNANLQTIWEQCQKFITSPIKEILYINDSDVNKQMLVSGDVALSEFSMLNPSRVKCYAIMPPKNKKEDLMRDTIIISWCDNDKIIANRCDRTDTQSKLEIWKYNPVLLGQNGLVDILSLALTYKNDSDERIEMAVDEMLKVFWEDY